MGHFSHPTTPDPAAQLRGEVEREILHGLQCEWLQAAESLPEKFRRRLRPPLFRLADLKTAWGTWRRDCREITLSRELAAAHSWDSLREILLHEMAHQLCEELMEGAGQPPHGPSFQQACRLLCANPAASGKPLPLDERIRNGQSCQPVDAVLGRVRKLLALAESANPHEAQSALAKANKLISSHGLEQAQMTATGEYESLFVGQPALRHQRDAYQLADLLIEHYHVYGVWVPAYVVGRGRMGRVLEISGRRHHLQIAVYVFEFIQRVIEDNWQRIRRNHRHRRPRRIDFALGLIAGFRDRLRSQSTCSTSASKVPVVVGDRQLGLYLKSRYPRLRSIYRQAYRQDSEIVGEGRRIGERLQVADALENAGNRPGSRLLPAFPEK